MMHFFGLICSTLSAMTIISPSCLPCLVLYLPSIMCSPPFPWLKLLSVSASFYRSASLLMRHWTFYSLLSTLRYLLIYGFCCLITSAPPHLSECPPPDSASVSFTSCAKPPRVSGAGVKDTILWPLSLELRFSRAGLRNLYFSHHPTWFSWPSNWGLCRSRVTPLPPDGEKPAWQRTRLAGDLSNPRSKEGWSHHVGLFQSVPLLSDLSPKVAAVSFLIKYVHAQIFFYPAPSRRCLRVVLFLKL